MKMWEYHISFQDPASEYAYQLITVHHDVIWYLILILVLVYWCLYKIIRDFNWRVFNRSSFIFFNLIPIFIYVERKGGMFIHRIFHLCMYLYIIFDHFSSSDIYPLYWYNTIYQRGSRLNEKFNSFEFWIYRNFIIDGYLRLIKWIFGKPIYWSSLVLGSTNTFQLIVNQPNLSFSFTGEFPYVNHNNLLKSASSVKKVVKISQMRASRVKAKISNLLRLDMLGNTFIDSYLWAPNLEMNKEIRNFIRWTPFIIRFNYWIRERYMSSLLFNYSSNAYFFIGEREENKLRSYYRKHALSNLSQNLSIYSAIEAISNLNYNDFVSYLPQRMDTDSIGRDVFFESQDFKHSLLFEFVWAIFPTVIISCILVPSLYLLYSLDDELDPKLTVKVIGHQWYWSYEFNNWIENEESAFQFVSYKFDSNIIPTSELEFGTKRLLEVDKRLIMPTGVPIRFLITSGDVLHSWAIPSLGIKIDAVPGRLNQVLGLCMYPGVYYGQCSELCGASHGFMPIVITAVDYGTFLKWLQLI